MKFTHKLLLAFILLSAYILANESIIIGASPVPHAQILQQIIPLLKQQGIELKIIEFNDYIQPNLLLEQKQLDANFFQHRPYLLQFNKEHKSNLIELTSVDIEPMAIYVNNALALSKFKQTKKIKDLPITTKLIVGIPNDTTNEGRALILLQSYGLIKLKPGVNFPTKKDIINNPYNLSIIELDPAMLPRALISQQIDLAVINANYALDAKLNFKTDAVFTEDKNSSYVNIIAVRLDNINQAKMAKLKSAIQSKLVKNYINSHHKDAIVPVF